MSEDTIAACATPPGRGGVAVIRLSGPAAAAAVRALTGPALPAPRVATLRRFRDPSTGELLDRGLLLWFPAPGSFTGEDVAEFHVHGGRAVVAGVLAALTTVEGVRPAEPGEFTRRAFHNGKLDLTEAEALADLIAADTAAQRRQALRQMEGALGRLYGSWRSRLLRALARMEADIDFPDEDLPADLAAAQLQELRAVATEISAHLADRGRGERLREGLHIAIIGAPNAGKSSLLNALAGREAAIVSARAGTTRDVVEVQLDLRGFPVILADTAGLRDTADEIEEEGVRRALARAAQADIRLAVFDGTLWPDRDSRTVALVDADTVVVVSKADLAGADGAPSPAGPALHVSARTGAGIAELEDRLAAMAAERLAGEGVALSRARHRTALAACEAALRRAMDVPLPELAAEDVRLATRELGRITGRVDVEEVLDVIFAEFCLGK